MNASYHDAYASDYDQQVLAYGCYLADALFGLCFEYIQFGETLLDLGIGSGLSSIPYAKAGLSVYGMDFSPAMLDLCRVKGIGVELKQHNLQQTPWPYPAEQFNHLVCCGMLHFTGELEAIFGEANRVLQAGGTFAFTTKAPLQAVPGDERNYEQQTTDGLDVFAHSVDYVDAVLARTQFARLKLLNCFVGQDIFSIWITRKTGQ